MQRRYDPSLESDRAELASQIQSMLTAKGLAPVRGTGSSKELVFTGLVGKTSLTVYTSIVRGVVRELDADAIRLVGGYQQPDRFAALVKPARVFRVGQVLAIVNRLADRVDQVRAELEALQPCPRCGSPMGMSKESKSYCLDLCWKRTSPPAEVPTGTPFGELRPGTFFGVPGESREIKYQRAMGSRAWTFINGQRERDPVPFNSDQLVRVLEG